MRRVRPGRVVITLIALAGLLLSPWQALRAAHAAARAQCEAASPRGEASASCEEPAPREKAAPGDASPARKNGPGSGARDSLPAAPLALSAPAATKSDHSTRVQPECAVARAGDEPTRRRPALLSACPAESAGYLSLHHPPHMAHAPPRG